MTPLGGMLTALLGLSVILAAVLVDWVSGQGHRVYEMADGY